MNNNVKPISLNKIIQDPDYRPALSFDTELSLSVIESGCLFVSVENESVLILKTDMDNINRVKNINHVSLGAELIERPEFPTLKVHIKLGAEQKESVHFEYFFNTESIEEIDLIRNITAQNHLYIMSYTSEIENCIRVELNTEFKDGIKSLLQSINAL